MGPDRLGVVNQFDGLGRRIGARAGDNRHTPGGGGDAEFYNPTVFVVAQGGGFACGANGH